MIDKIRSGQIDCNMQQNFIGTLIKGVLYELTRLSGIPHMVIHTGDDTMWLYERGYDASKEPLLVTNQEGIYQKVPYCSVNVSGVTTLPDQLSNPYTRGILQLEHDNRLYSLSGEFRRMPLQMEFSLEYFSDSFTMMLEHIQFIITHLSYISTFYITYLGQSICVSMKTPDSVDKEHLMDLDGLTSEGKSRKVSISLEVETVMPIYNQKTIVDDTKRISKGSGTIKEGFGKTTIDTTRRSKHS